MITTFYPFEGFTVKDTMKNIILDKLELRNYKEFKNYSQDFKMILDFMFEK